MTLTAPALVIEHIDTIHAADRAAWDAIAAGDPDGTPFHLHAFLAAFEDTGCTGERAGWVTAHVIARDAVSGRLVGFVPAFIKTHSMGEFVFDFAWADAAHRAGLAYYPKLVAAAPFSPVTGRRLFAAADLAPAVATAVRVALLDGLVALGEAAGCSGVHILFALPDEVALAESRGFAARLGCQFHWRNEGYADFEAFLARFPSKRRNQIRRERRQVAEQGVEIRHYRGDMIADAFRDPTRAFYQATVDRYVYGRRYLNQAFFERLWSDLRSHLQLTLAFAGDRIVGGAMNVEAAPRRFGRYWGALADVPALHFEVCAYAGIEDCIARGIGTFEAGAGGEEHKLKRGFLPSPVRSVHRVFVPQFQKAIAAFCAEERDHVERSMHLMERDVYAH
jgi:predicted N-acyltransferase